MGAGVATLSKCVSVERVRQGLATPAKEWTSKSEILRETISGVRGMD